MKQRKLEKRMVSLVLAAVMLLGYIPVTTWAVDSTTDIKAIQKPTGMAIVEDYDDYFGENWLDKLSLPGEVTVTLADGQAAAVPVTWDISVLDPRTPGYYYLPGTVTLPAGATNGQNLDVTITIQVREKVNLLSNPSFEDGKTGWGIGSGHKTNGTPAADGNYALQVGSKPAEQTKFNLLFPSDPVALAELVAAEGAGQYYISAQVREYLKDGEIAHTDALQAYIRLGNKTDAGASSSSNKGYTETVTLSDSYVSTGGVFDLTGEDVWLRTDLYLKSATAFSSQWILVDDMQFIPLKVALKAEPAVITEVKTQIQSRFVALNYDKYVGENWKESLGLPTTVEAQTENGDPVTLGVTWNYSSLDLTKTGKYTITGTLDDSAYPNPKGLTVQQHIYVRNPENLFSNSSFENATAGWSFGSTSALYGTPAALGDYALQVKSPSSSKTPQNIMFPSNTTELAEKVAQKGIGQYYISAQLREYLKDGEIAHADPLQAYIRVGYKTDPNASSSTTKGNTATVTLSDDGYITTGGVFHMTGEEVWLRTDLYLKSATAFTSQWVLVDDMQFFALNVLIPFGEEPADIVEVTGEIPVRAVVQNYDKYVGENWKDSLGLPTSVEVLTAKGTKTDVNVTWNYSELDLTKTGKYTLVGTLDDSAYPNPAELFVKQVIYIREYKNLFTNPSFEGGLTGWSYGSTYKEFGTPAAIGKYALQVRTSPSEKTSFNMLFPSNTTELAEKVARAGAGQYYIGVQVRDFVGEGETTHKDALKAYLRVNYKLDLTAASSTLKGTTKEITLSSKAYEKTGGIFDLTGHEAWIRTDLYLKSDTPFTSQWVMVDDMEFVALNVIVEQYEGTMESVETIIPERNIIQNYQNYIDGYTTADLMFPETVEVRTSTGQTVDVGVKWNYSMLDLTKTGKYTVVGALEDMKLANPNGLTVDQVVNVVAYENLLSNPSFEDHDDYWTADTSHVTIESGVTSPAKDDTLSLKMTVGRLDGYSRKWIQSLFLDDTADLGLRITAHGGGRYYFGGWAHGTENSTDIQVYTRLHYKHFAGGDQNVTNTAGAASLTVAEYVQSASIVELPDDIYWSRLDFYLSGEVAALRNSILYMDHMELVPLNVEAPNMADVIDCETIADTYVHENTNFADLNLPNTLQITIKNGQKFQIPVKWDTEAYDPHKIGVQTITGTMELGDKFKNAKNFIPTVTIYVRAKGENLRQTIYISNDGSEDNDGFSPDRPKKEITNLSSYLASGHNVKLNRGDIWYIPTASISLSNIHGTENAPLSIGAYGSGELPVIAFMRKVENYEWKLVDEKRNVYAVDVSSFGQKDGESVHRCFVADEAYFHLSRSNYVTLKEKEFCSYNDTLYVRMPAGEAPHDVEITPLGSGSTRMPIKNVSYLTFENLHIKGGSSIYPIIRMDAPTKFVKFSYVTMTHGWYYQILLEADDEDIHYKPEFSNMFIDAMLNEKEGAVSGYYSHYWNPHTIEGICMRDGVDGAWIHDCHMRNMSHAFVAIESLDEEKEAKTTGVRNCIVEDNVFEGGNALYARALNIGSAINLSGIDLGHDCIFRRNKCYDMSVSSHLFGNNYLVYSNLFSYSHTTYNEDGTLFDGKGAQPWGFDTVTFGSSSGCVGTMLVNNTFYDVAGAIAVYATSDKVQNCIYANNLVVNWKSDPNGAHGEAGAFADDTTGFNYFMNNGLYSHTNATDHFMVNNKIYSTEDVNVSVAGYSGNIYADPRFMSADLTLLGKGVRQDFTLSNESPMRYAGLSLYDSVYENFPAWERLKAEYTDINGVPYLAESPSIGAWSFCELITGDVAEVGQLEEIVARPGASFDDLALPDTVPAVNEAGIDVVLLVTWDDANFDSSKPGVITLTGELRNGPHTDLNINGRTATINVNIKDKLELMSIVTVVDMLTVLYGTPLEDAIAQLPDKLHVVEESGFEEDLPVTWICEDYKPNVTGDYTFKCVLPEAMLTNAREFSIEVQVRVLHEIGRGMELLINPDFIDGTSAAPWKIGWCSGATGSFSITEDSQYLPDGEPAAAIVTVTRRYASIQQNVTGQVKLMGDGKYLFRMLMRAYDPNQPIDTSTPCFSLTGKQSQTILFRPHTNIGEEYVEYYQIIDVTNAQDLQTVIFHTSTWKSREDAEDGPRSFVIAGCSLIYLGATDAEVEATLDSIDLTWNTIKGENGYDKGNIMSDLNLPSKIGAASKITWTSSNESAISNDGKVTMGRLPQTVTLTATITYGNIETIKKFTVTVPRDPELPTFTGTLSGSQTVTEGEVFKVTISLKSDKATSFNAYRFTLSFNTSKLEYVGISDSSSTVVVEGGKITVSGIGTERPITDTITLTFKAKKSGITEVKLVKVEMDSDPGASLEALPTMYIDAGAALIDVQKAADNTVAPADKDNSVAIYIVICIVAALAVCGGVLAWLIIKKKKQTPNNEA